MRKLTLLESLLTLLICTGCRNTIHEDIASMMGQHFVWNQNIDRNFDTDISLTPNPDDRYSLIVYYDSLECMACHSNRLNAWNKFIRICDNHKVGVFFIFSPKKNDISNLRMNLLRQRFKHPVFVDTCGNTGKNNNWIPKNRMCHTFLLNSENEVIMIGDPRKTESLMSLFLSIVK